MEEALDRAIAAGQEEVADRIIILAGSIRARAGGMEVGLFIIPHPCQVPATLHGSLEEEALMVFLA